MCQAFSARTHPTLNAVTAAYAVTQTGGGLAFGVACTPLLLRRLAAEAQDDAVLEADGVTDDFSQKAMPTITG